jgi:hypothetical protein
VSLLARPIGVELQHRAVHNGSNTRFQSTGGRSCLRMSPIGVRFTQRMLDFPEPPIVVTDFRMLAYGVMEK